MRHGRKSGSSEAAGTGGQSRSRGQADPVHRAASTSEVVGFATLCELIANEVMIDRGLTPRGHVLAPKLRQIFDHAGPVDLKEFLLKRKNTRQHQHMQIMLNQDEIEEAIRNHVLNQLAIRDDQEITIDLRAGRGENGFTATLDIRNRYGPDINPPKQGPRLVRGVTDELNQPEPYEARPDPEPILKDWTGKEIDDQTEVPGPTPREEPETKVPAATGVTKKAAAKKAEIEAPKKTASKSIFATPAKSKEKQADNRAPTEDSTDNQAEEEVPNQETPIQEQARETAQEATASNPFASDEDEDEDEDASDGAVARMAQPEDELPAEKPKSIFGFAAKPKTPAE